MASESREPTLRELLRFAVGLKVGGYVGCLLINGVRRGHRLWRQNQNWTVHNDPHWPADVLLGERDANEFLRAAGSSPVPEENHDD